MEDIIVIKPRRGQHALYIISLVFLLFAAVAMMDVVLSLSVLIFTYSIILNLYFLDTRTLIISRQGICAKFGLYKRDYKCLISNASACKITKSLISIAESAQMKQ